MFWQISKMMFLLINSLANQPFNTLDFYVMEVVQIGCPMGISAEFAPFSLVLNNRIGPQIKLIQQQRGSRLFSMIPQPLIAISQRGIHISSYQRTPAHLYSKIYKSYYLRTPCHLKTYSEINLIPNICSFCLSTVLTTVPAGWLHLIPFAAHLPQEA